jgi:tetratricopeptide (TPR) repeat protein
LLLVVMAVVGYAAYEISRYVWGRNSLNDAQQALRHRDFHQASAYLDAYLKNRPHDGPVRLMAAQTARRRGDFDEARKHLGLYAKGAGSQEALVLEHSLLRLQQGDIRDANTLLAVAQDKPSAPETPLILECVFESMLNELAPPYSIDPNTVKRADDATMAQLGQALDGWLQGRTAPADHVQGLVWRGRLRRVDKQHHQAEADFRKALELDPDHFQARLHLAVAVFHERPEEAERHLRLLSQRFACDTRLRLCLAVVSRVLGHLQQADELLSGILTDNPHDVFALLERGQLALDLQRPDDALRDLRRAVELAPNEPETNFALSRGLRLTGKLTEAQTYHERFLTLRAVRDRQRQKPSHAPREKTDR